MCRFGFREVEQYPRVEGLFRFRVQDLGWAILRGPGDLVSRL